MFKTHRRERLRNETVPEAWLGYLDKHFPLFRTLSKTDKCELLGHIHVFLSEIGFEGCGGLEITDEIRVTIAAQACLLLLHRKTDYFPRLRTIIVYPKDYVAKSNRSTSDGFVIEGDSHRLGESWTSGSVVLAWNAVRKGGASPEDGHNVVFHEFAHQLDQEDGSVSGAPALGQDLKLTERRSKYVSWARVMRTEYEHLQFMETHGHRDLIDSYGATNPAEFFAVCVETFFERGKALHCKHPELYAELKDYFKQDPAARE